MQINRLEPLKGSLLLTLRELWAMRITQALFVVSTLAWLLMSFAMNLDVVEGSISAIRLFGFETQPANVERTADGQIIRQGLALSDFLMGINQFIFGASYMLGTLLGLFATMPLIGGFLEPGRIDLFLSKPISRVRLLSGHVLGVWLTVLALTSYLMLGVWLVLSIKSGEWMPLLLVSIPVTTIMFGVMYSVLMTLTIMIRSSGLPLIVTYALIFFSIIFALHDQILPVLGPTASVVYQGFYYALPNFIEMIMVVAQLTDSGDVSRWGAVISTLSFGVLSYAVGFIWFARRDF